MDARCKHPLYVPGDVSEYIVVQIEIVLILVFFSMHLWILSVEKDFGTSRVAQVICLNTWKQILNWRSSLFSVQPHIKHLFLEPYFGPAGLVNRVVHKVWWPSPILNNRNQIIIAAALLWLAAGCVSLWGSQKMCKIWQAGEEKTRQYSVNTV